MPKGTALVAADQNEEMQTRMFASGQHAALAARVTYANFLGGPAILEAFRAGALDFATVGNTPPIQAQAAGETIPIIAAVQSADVDYRFAACPGLSIVRLEDLRGKRISYGEGTGRQPFVLGALQVAGTGVKEVTLMPLRAADFPDAVRSSQLDIAVLNEPHYSRDLADYADRGAKPLPDSEYARMPRGLSYLYASAAALRDPAKTAALAEFVSRWIIARRWCTAQPTGAADGFNVMPPILPTQFEAFMAHVLPILRRRGLFRTEYRGTTLRSHLGPQRPPNQFFPPQPYREPAALPA